MALMLWAAPAPVRELPSTTYRFISYMTEMERSGQKLGFWDRITISLVLAGEDRRKPPGAIRRRLTT